MTGFLLDTNAALWLVEDNGRLGPRTHALIATGPTWVSSASIWEAKIKETLGKLAPARDLTDGLAEAGVRELEVTWTHANSIGVVELPHGDPFDRMLVAQAKAEGLTFITADRQILAAELPFVHNARD